MADNDTADIPELRPFEGKLVEIIDVVEKLQPVSDTQDGQPLDLNGLKGRVVSWIADADKYAVEVFHGELVPVSEENLVEYDPPDPAEGGFDVCWYVQPNSLDSAVFAAMMASHLEKKGCCVVQTFLGAAGCQQAWEIAEQLQGFHVMSNELQTEYLGREDVGQRTTWLYNDGVLTLNMEEFEALRGADEVSSALEICDRTFSCIAAHLYPYVPNFEEEELQFTPWGRTNGLVRMSFKNEAEEAELCKLPRSFSEAHELDEHHNLLESKKICMMYLIGAEGGSLTLHAEDGDVVIPLEPNMSKVVVFREDQMSYSYEPRGQHLALQAWLLDQPTSHPEQIEALRTLDGPPEPEGERVNVMSMAFKYPVGTSAESTWAGFTIGMDGFIQVPKTRWDIDVYYRAEHTPGFSMTCHGGMMEQQEIVEFDNNFFGFSEEYTMAMSPSHRLGIEKGYEALYAAGFRKDKLRGSELGVFCGDSGSDYTQFRNGLVFVERKGENKYRYENSWNSQMCNRLSTIYGMVGPVHTCETACSSSLVAIGMAHEAMRKPGEDEPRTSAISDVRQCLVMGINLLLGAGSYIFLSGPGMLTHKGRCFTFNQSADGFARGEGVGTKVLRTCRHEIESLGRLAMLVGSCINQDGRSASMTAPHGPSQTEVIKASMKEAGLSTKEITIAECHGTGTALGDPIEIGSLRNVMSKERGDCPLLVTSAKTNVGHLEAGAGSCGLLKCILMLRHSLGAPNLHCCEFNPHLDLDGFPQCINIELADFMVNSGLTGVSSFGFGGTNARADVWAHSVKGHRSCLSGSVMTLKTVFM